MGYLDGKLVNPAMPNCQLGVVVDTLAGEFIYLIESGDWINLEVSPDISKHTTAPISKKILDMINEYLKHTDLSIVEGQRNASARHLAKKMAVEMRDEIDNDILNTIKAEAEAMKKTSLKGLVKDRVRKWRKR